MDEAIALAGLLAQLLPTAVTLYDKIVANNQNAGLVPAATLLADVIATSSTIEKTAEAEIAAAENVPPTGS